MSDDIIQIHSSQAPNKKLMYRFHKLPYNYKPGVTRSRHHGNRINACIEQEERSVTRSRQVHGINVCAEQQEPDVTTSRHTPRNTGCSEQQGPGSSMSRKKENWMDACTSQRKAHSAPPQTISIESTTRSAFTPVTNPVGRRQSVPLISTPLRPLPWYPDPTPLVLPLSTAQSRIIAPVAVETMTFGIEPYVPVSQPVEQVAPIVHVAATTPSSIRVSVIKRTQPF